MQQVILASQSQQRRLLMETLGIPFEIKPADIDEKAITGDTFEERVEKIARAKAETIAAHTNGIIIAADSFVVVDGQTLEKPIDIAEARTMLRTLSGTTMVEYNGYCYLDSQNGMNISGALTVSAQMRELSELEIERYVTTQPVTTWAGAYSPAYHEGAALFAEVNGSLTGFTHGFPMEIIVPLLHTSKVL